MFFNIKQRYTELAEIIIKINTYINYLLDTTIKLSTQINSLLDTTDTLLRSSTELFEIVHSLEKRIKDLEAPDNNLPDYPQND